MYQTGDMIMHPGAGVCRIEDIRREKFPKMEVKTYYILRPVYESGATTIYLPTDNDKVNLRKLLSADDIYNLIHSVSGQDTLWIDNDAQRQELFSEIIREGDHAKVIGVIKELHEKQRERQAAGKKLHIADRRILQEAERLLHQELAYSLKLKPEEVAPFIMGELNVAGG